MTVTSVTAVAVSFRATSVSVPPEPDAPAAQSPRTAAAARRADTLLTRLDTDEDGTVSKDEFTTGAIALLKRAAARAHHRHVGRGEGSEKREERLRARLERAFDRIDANGDGSLEHGELAARLTPKQRAGRGSGHDCESACPPAATTTVTNVTLVAVAIRRYTLDATQAPAAQATQATEAAQASEAAPIAPAAPDHTP